MPYGYRRRRRRTYGRPVVTRRRRMTGARRYGRARSSFRRTRSSNYGRYQRSPMVRRRRATRRAGVRRARPRTIRIVVQTVSTSPVALGDKGKQPTRALF